MASNLSSTPDKKKRGRDFRRETMELIKDLNLTDNDIARQMSVSPRSVYRWRKGIGSPHLSQFERLKQLAAGELKHTAGEDQKMTEVLLAIGRMEGRMIEKFDNLEKRLDDVEGKKRGLL